MEIKSNGGIKKTPHVVKVKGEKGNEQVEFEIIGAKLEDGQKTAIVRWDKWKEPEAAGESLNGNARLLLECARKVIISKGQEQEIIPFDTPRQSVQKRDVLLEFNRRHKGDRHDMAFKRSWDELVKKGFITWIRDEHSSADLDVWVCLEKG
jgi:hypothetical protein